MLTDSEDSQCSYHYSPENRNCGNNVFEKSNNCTEPVIVDDVSQVMSGHEEYPLHAQDILKEKQQKRKRKQDSNGPILKKKPMNVEEIMKKANVLSEKDTHISLLYLLMLMQQ